MMDRLCKSGTARAKGEGVYCRVLDEAVVEKKKGCR
jgi:hypothetical protein